jgi:hypothetical protein
LVELKTVAFDVGVDYANLRDTTILEFILDLLAYCERRDLLTPLLESALQERPVGQDTQVTQILNRLKPPPVTNNKKPWDQIRW